jgi:hypothetical protein
MDNLLAGNMIPPLRRFAYRIVIQRRTLFRLWKSFRDQGDHESGIGRLMIGFAPESVIAFNPER